MVESKAGRLRYLRHGCIVTPKESAIGSRLLAIFAAISDLIEEWEPDEAVRSRTCSRGDGWREAGQSGPIDGRQDQGEHLGEQGSGAAVQKLQLHVRVTLALNM